MTNTKGKTMLEIIEYLKTTAGHVTLFLIAMFALYIGWKALEHYCEHRPIMEPYDPGNQARIAAEHVAKLDCKHTFDTFGPYLRRELKDHKNPTPPGEMS